ncbi:MAG: Rha family transcriptional regulator [Cytophagaceae bacterium]|jgi:Rha family phage regulatory protein|nr:Rha family transcriptional regulator [Cytophagaceae bacterium]
METLVKRNETGQAVTTSLLVAEKFEKEHRDVLKSIRNLTAQNCAVLSMFVETTYLNEQNKQQPMFVMNRDGFSLLVMSFSGEKALQFKLDFIEAFNSMDAILRNNDTLRISAVEENIKRRYLLSRELRDVNSQITALMKRHDAIKKEQRAIDSEDFMQLSLYPRYEAFTPLKNEFPNKNKMLPN